MPYTLTIEFSPLSSLPPQELTKKSKSTASGVQFLMWLAMGTTAGRALESRTKAAMKMSNTRSALSQK